MPGRGFTVPPGRAGRLWLQRRLLVAERSAELLDRKLRILRLAVDARRDAAARAAADWDRCNAEAQRWLLRASLLGGERAIRVASGGDRADVTIDYGSVMGIRHPVGASCVFPGPATWDGPALSGARQAHRTALQAAVRHAAAAEALRLVEAETAATRHRLRAIKDRRIPRLQRALAEVTLAIEEQEISDAARLRLAAGQRDPVAAAGESSSAELNVTRCQCSGSAGVSSPRLNASATAAARSLTPSLA